MMNRSNSPIDFDLDDAMLPVMEAAHPTADFGRYHALRPDTGSACNTRRTSVPTSAMVVVIKHDANAL